VLQNPPLRQTPTTSSTPTKKPQQGKIKQIYCACCTCSGVVDFIKFGLLTLYQDYIATVTKNCIGLTCIIGTIGRDFIKLFLALKKWAENF
jgi:hypothetical protein